MHLLLCKSVVQNRTRHLSRLICSRCNCLLFDNKVTLTKLDLSPFPPTDEVPEILARVRRGSCIWTNQSKVGQGGNSGKLHSSSTYHVQGKLYNKTERNRIHYLLLFLTISLSLNSNINQVIRFLFIRGSFKTLSYEQLSTRKTPLFFTDYVYSKF